MTAVWVWGREANAGDVLVNPNGGNTDSPGVPPGRGRAEGGVMGIPDPFFVALTTVAVADATKNDEGAG